MSLINLSHKDPDTDHMPIISMEKFVERPHGGYERWMVGCLCGWFDKGTNGKVIPSKESAERLYEEHARRAGVSATVPQTSDTEETSMALSPEIQTFEKKVTIQALRYDGFNVAYLREFCEDVVWDAERNTWVVRLKDEGSFRTLKPGQWLVKEVEPSSQARTRSGNFYMLDDEHIEEVYDGG